MTARIYSIAFVLASGFFGLLSHLPPAIAQTKTPQTQTSESKPIALSLQQPIARELKGGETHSYVVSLKSRQFFQVIAEQKGIDLVILLYSPSGRLIARSNSPNDRLGLEVMSAIADRDGSYRLEINSLESEIPMGNYNIKVEELRDSTDRDRSYVIAERAFMEAVQLNESNVQLTEARKRQALAKYLEAIRVFREQGKRYWEMQTLNSVGNITADLEQSVKVIDYYQQSLRIARQIGDRSGEWKALNNIGVVYDNLGQYSEALEYYQKSLVISKQIGDLFGEGKALSNIGVVYISLGQYAEALEYHQRTLAITKQIGDRSGEWKALSSIGKVYDYLGQYAKALEYYQKSLVISKQIGDLFGEGEILSDIGWSYSSLGQHAKALEYYQKSLVISKQIGDRLWQGVNLNYIGTVYDSLGQHAKALEYYQKSLAISKQIGDRQGQGVILNNFGEVYRNLGQYAKALEYYQQSLAISKQIGDRYGEGMYLSNIGYALKAQTQIEMAILFLKESVKVHESIRKALRTLSREDQQSFTHAVADTYRILADLLLKQGRVTEALQIIDLLKIQELEDYLKNVKGNDRTAQGIRLLEPEKAISGQLSAISFEKMSELNRDLASKIQQLPKSEINRVPDYLQKLPQGAVLIYPLILKDRLELIVFSANTLPINRTVPIKKVELEKLVAAFRADLQDRSSLDVKDSSKKVYEVLIKPIEADLKQANATTILYAPDGTLRYIPLAALYDGKQWLVEKYRVNNLIAYSLFDPDSKTQSNIRIFTGAFGNSDKGLPFNLSRLPATIPEVDRIQSLFPNTTKLVEQEFTAQASKEKVSGNAIVHFATHAKFISGSPLESYVLFGDGSKVTLAEINEWQLKDADLVVLSACETGVGSLGNGSEILGFGYQVQRAGAKASIASLWRVSDGGTQLLMEAFYGNLQKGNASMSTSLREAQLSMIRRPIKDGGVNYNHPYYWSAFVLIGNGL